MNGASTELNRPHEREGAVSGLETAALRPVMRQLFRRYRGYVAEPSQSVESITLRSADGTPLEGALMNPATAAARGVLVFCHPLLKYGYHYFLRGGLAAWAVGEGFHSILFNFKGIGRSGLSGICFADDVIGAVSFARARFPGLPVYLVGHSFGGYHAAHALPKLEGKVAGAVFDSVPPQIATFFRTGPTALVMKGLSRSPWAAVTGTRPVAASLAGVRRTPVLWIFGDADEYCPTEEARALASARPDSRLLLLPGAGHLQGFRHHRDAYTQAVRECWET
jgi:pimeloyl-ACP methyl ester carboxylesterase